MSQRILSGIFGCAPHPSTSPSDGTGRSRARLWCWGVLTLVLLGMVSAQFLREQRVEAQSGGEPAFIQTWEDFQYEGAFRLPDAWGGVFGPSRFGYGGTAIAYNPANDSLFLIGHPGDQLAAEISIPEVRKSDQRSDLAFSSVLQNFADPTDGLLGAFGTAQGEQAMIGGLLVDGDKLYGTVYIFYDGAGDADRSHFVSSLDLSNPSDAQGLYRVGDINPGFTAGYLARVPEEWRAAIGAPFLTGQAALSIRARTSWGPSAFAFDPADLGKTSPVPAKPLVYYSIYHPTLGDVSEQNDFFNGTTQITGILFPEGSRSVLFFGSHGLGTVCYGTGAACNDPVESDKGYHAYPYVYQVWAYDVLDLLPVIRGEKQPWEVRPYAIFRPELPFAGGGNAFNGIGGVAYDPATRRVFVSQRYVDLNPYGYEPQPIIHVFQVDVVAKLPQVISTIKATNITADGATITWTTDEPADSQVEYGTTDAYGNSTSLNASLVLSHSQGLTGLSASTLYHYRVKSKDGSANLAVSTDQTFTTSLAPELCLSPRPENRIRLAREDYSGLATTLTITDPQGIVVYSAVHTPANQEGDIHITDSAILANISDATLYTLTAHPESHRRRKMMLLGSQLKTAPCDVFPGSVFGFLDESGPVTLPHLVRLIAHYRTQSDAQVHRAFLNQNFLLRDLITVIKLFVSNVTHE